MKYKNVDQSVKDVDTVKGVVTGYFSVFGNKDSDGDIILPGAFKKTLSENGPQSARPRILHLYQHRPEWLLAKPAILKEDDRGLYFESQISHTTMGKDVIQLYQDGVLTEHSIGFNIVKWERDENSDTTKLTELKLWEGSTVSWGANMEARVEDVKSIDKEEWGFLLEKLDTMTKALRDGTYSDETMRQLQIHTEQLKTFIISLAKEMEPPKSTPQVEEPGFDVDDVISKLKSNIKFLNNG
jgi:HK97 family phage prohead protease